MRDRAERGRVLAVAVALAIALVSVLAARSGGATAAPARQDGLQCLHDQHTGGANGSSTFVLTARTGTITAPDGNTVFMWGFASGRGAYQYPSPTLCVTEGDRVTVVLRNTLPDDVSIVFPGQDGVTANGAPSVPVTDGGRVTSLAPAAPKRTGVATYSFVAGRPGTFLYESGTDQGRQVQMGLFGALIVRPKDHPDQAYGPQTGFAPDREYLMLLSDIDPDLHAAVEQGRPFDLAKLHPHYWMINGRSFPDTIAPNGASWLPSQPYGALARLQPFDAQANPRPALIRYLNVSAKSHPFHPHGNHERLIARDGAELRGAGGEDLSSEHFTDVVGPGQTLDALAIWTDVEHWDPVTNPIPLKDPALQDVLFKDGVTYYSGSPYLGHQDELPVGTTAFNQCGEYYHVMHSHALDEVTNFGAAMGGMLTLERIDPPSPNRCP